MIEEQARVLSVEADSVWVETIRRNTCGSCQARAGCGQALLQKLGSGARRGFIRALCDQKLQVGDEVIIGLPEDAVVKASALMYALPLIMLFLFAVLSDVGGLAEVWVILAAFGGLAFGFFLVAWRTKRELYNPAYHARVLRSKPSGFAERIPVSSSF